MIAAGCTRRRMAMTVLLSGALGLLVACGRGPGGSIPPANRSVESLIGTLRSDDPETAYALLSEEVRSRVDFEEFAAKWRSTTREREARASRIEAELRTRPAPQERARVPLQSGGAVYLVREGNVWRLESPLLSSDYASRPEDAVRYFAQAVTKRDYEALLRILTERRRALLGSAVTDLVDSLSEHLDSGVDTVEMVNEERAILRWDDDTIRYELHLHREADEWRIDELHMRRALSSD